MSELAVGDRVVVRCTNDYLDPGVITGMHQDPGGALAVGVAFDDGTSCTVPGYRVTREPCKVALCEHLEVAHVLGPAGNQCPCGCPYVRRNDTNMATSTGILE